MPAIGTSIGIPYVRPRGLGEAVQFVLDQVSGANCGLALHQLSESATQCIRVRRSSDSAEQDFGFTASGSLDTAAILSFCGAGDGRVVRWYQQLAAAASVMSDLTQTTATLQPYIVQGGVIVTDPDTGKPAIRQPTSGAGAEYLTATSWVTRPTDAAEIFVGLMTPESRRECISSTISAGVYAGFAENGSSGGVAVASGAPTYYVNRAPISAQTRQALYDAVVPTGQKIVTGEELSFSNSDWDDYRTEFTQQTGVDGPEYQSCRIILDAPTAGQISQVESRLAAHYGITLP